MTALRVVRTAMVGVVLVLTLGSGIAAAQTTPTLKIDVQLYDLGDTVTYTGTGFAGCDNITVTVNGRSSYIVVATGISPVNGSFTGTFEVTMADEAGYGVTTRADPVPGPCNVYTTLGIASVRVGHSEVQANSQIRRQHGVEAT